MKLNEEAKNKMRKLIEDEFKNVPEGIKIKLDIEMLDELIFSYGYWRKDNDDNYKEFKVPVWTPDCLSKIDLSQLSFKNIWLDGDEMDFGEFDYETERKYEDGFPFVLSREERMAYPNRTFINFKNTNIKIDFREALPGDRMMFWNLSGVDLSESHIDCLEAIEGCDLSNTNINLDNIDWFIKQPYDDNRDDNKEWFQIFHSNFSGNDLSRVKFNIENLDHNDFSNTGLRIRYSKENVNKKTEETLRNSLKSGYLVGCYLNGTLIKENDTLENILNRAEAQEQELLNSLTASIKAQIPINQDETELENGKHI